MIFGDIGSFLRVNRSNVKKLQFQNLDEKLKDNFYLELILTDFKRNIVSDCPRFQQGGKSFKMLPFGIVKIMQT
jgi:hypothetical protein